MLAAIARFRLWRPPWMVGCMDIGSGGWREVCDDSRSGYHVAHGDFV